MADLYDTNPLASPPLADEESVAPAYGCHISLTRIIALSIVSMGIYWIYWMYRTWKQYRDHTGDVAYPVWHALTQFVPIYQWFRFYAHIKAYKNLMDEQSVPNSLMLGLIMIITIIASLVANALLSAGFGLESVSIKTELTLDIIGWIATLVTVIILCWVQSNINRYWAGVDHRLAQSARFGKGEILVVVIGVILWLFTILYYLFPE